MTLDTVEPISGCTELLDDPSLPSPGSLRRLRTTILAVFAFAMLVGMTAVPTVAWAAPGDLDPDFGDGGRVTATFGAGSGANDIAIAPGGALIAAGSFEGRVAVFAFRPRGEVDTSFGEQGATWVTLGQQGDEANAIAIQPNGKIIVVGTDSRQRFVTMRFQTDGDLDPTFGGDGVVRTAAGAGFRVANDVVIQPNGRIVVVGWSGDRTPKWALVRYLPDGRKDPTFGSHGLVETSYRWAMGYGAALQPDGRIVVTGYSSWGFAVARYLPDGRLDPTFGDGGKIAHDEPSLLITDAVSIRPDGKLILGGARDIFRHALVRLLPDGRFDRSFGGNGVVVVHTGCCEQNITSVIPLAGGKVLGTGYAGPHESADEAPARFVALRVRNDGTLDDTWGGDGKVVTYFPGGARAWGAALREDGRLVLAGAIGLNGGEGIALARLLA
jgi:uncharacterized delta-60 repeat protein